jgi:S1-C subfamily serine protease
VAALGRASVLEVGDWVMAIGSPIDLAQTVSLGIVSALRETVRIDGITYSNMIQTDAHINRGNSGGPLVNLYGDVVGVNTAIYTPGGSFTGVGFAMPIDAANNLLDELNIAQHRFVSTVANLNKPQVKHGAWLGIGSVSLTPLLIDHYGVPVDHGAYITEVLAGSPAERAGLKEGDVIVWVDDTLVADVAQLKSVLARKFPGKEIVLSVCRGSQVFDVSAITTEKW